MSEPHDAQGFAFPVALGERLHSAGSALLPVEDRGFQQGLALFETLLVEGGHAFFLAAHVERLQRAAKRLSLSCSGELAARAVANYVQQVAQIPGSPSRYALRLTLTPGAPGATPALLLNARLPSRWTPEGSALWVSALRQPADELANLKSSSRLRYALALEEARAEGCEEALLLNAAGELAEGTLSNVLLFSAGKLRTPPLAAGCLGGITRELLLEDLEREPLTLTEGVRFQLRCEPIPMDQLGAAEELILCNSVAPLVAARSVRGGPELPALPGSTGPLFGALCKRLAALQATDRG